MTPNAHRLEVLGTRFWGVSAPELIDYLVEAARTRSRSRVAHVNIHALNLAYENPWFRDFLNTVELVYADGFGPLLAGGLLRGDLRATCPDFIEDLGRACRDAGVSMFLLAGQPGVAEDAARKLEKAAPGLEVQAHHGHFEKAGAENAAAIGSINTSRPGLLLVGFGMPLQEQWIRDNFARVDAGAVLTIGAALDFYTGRVPRAPRFLTDHGLEWLTRLITEPRRLAHRYLVGNPRFVARVLRQLLSRRGRGGAPQP